MFDLADAAKAMAQFEHASGASPEATTQLVQVTIVEDAFLERCL
jgi:hypothetical protein